MKLTESALRKIIKEELNKVLNEGKGHPLDDITKKMVAIHDKAYQAGGTPSAMFQMLLDIEELKSEIKNLFDTGQVSDEDFQDYVKNKKNFEPTKFRSAEQNKEMTDFDDYLNKNNF
jgi:succinate dehydrogenase/fumarate reductase flavoprotein subunit